MAPAEHSGLAWNHASVVLTASLEATSPPPCPPAPSQTTQKHTPQFAQKPNASSLVARPPGFDSTEISRRIAVRGVSAGTVALLVPSGPVVPLGRLDSVRLVGLQEFLAEQRL